MATHRKAFRFRMRPTKAQKSILNRLAGARRWVWNWGLQRWKDYFEANGKSIGLKQLSAELTALKQEPEMAWLQEADSQALQQTLKDLHRAFTNFFEGRARYPRFKSRKRDPLRFRIPQRVKIEGPSVIIPKVGKVRIFKSMDIDLPTKSASFKRDALGHWHVTLTAEFEMPDLSLPVPEKAVGIDLGLIDFATLSDGSGPIPAPKFFRKGQRKLKRDVSDRTLLVIRPLILLKRRVRPKNGGNDREEPQERAEPRRTAQKPTQKVAQSAQSLHF